MGRGYRPDPVRIRNQPRPNRRTNIERQWVVLLEAAATSDHDNLPPVAVERLLQTLSDHQPTIVCHQRRCSVQLQVEASSGAEALFSACARWRDAARNLGLPVWPLARAEVLTLGEFQKDLADPGDRVPAIAGGGRRDSLPDDLLPRALQDSLTGLVNRELFADCVRSVLADDGLVNDSWAVLVLDLDNFGALNQSAGPPLGDRLLAVLASRISRIPGHTMVARLGGDEFAVLAHAPGPGDIDRLATRVLETIRTPVELGGRRVAVTASVGLATSAHMSHPDDLIRDAAVAMCIAKADGGDCWRRFDPAVNVDVKRLDFDADPAPDRLAYVLLLERAALAANECRTLEDAAVIVLQQVCTHTGWSLGRLSVVGSTGEWVEPTALWHTRGPDRFEAFRTACDSLSLGLGQGLAGRVLQTAKSASVLALAYAESVPASVASAAADAGIKSAYALPILVGDEVVAVLEFYSSGTARLHDALHEVLTGVCAQLGRVAERDRARAALARSEEKYRTLADSVPVLMWMTGSDGRARTFNRAWLDFTGRTQEQEMAGRGVACIHPDDVERSITAYRTAFERRAPVAMEYRLRRADGEYRIIAGQAQPIGAGGDFLGFVGGGIDITDRCRAEAALANSEARLRALVATSGAMIVLMAADGTVLADYQGASGGLGYTEGSTAGRQGFDFVHPDDLARTTEAFAAILDQPGLTVPFECRVRHADGPWRWVEAVGNNLLDYPPVEGIVISAIDITRRKAAEDALAQAEQRLREAADKTRLGQWHWNFLTGDIAWSDQMFEIYGVAGSGARTFGDIASYAIHPADRVTIAAIMAAVKAGQPSGVFEYRIVRPDGQIRRVRGQAVALRDGSGRLASMSGTIEDVTDDVASEDTLGHSGAA
jgi:diguanylate cyclase (GGDEF)-like protein/PAS domain S-box-containing protein